MSSVSFIKGVMNDHTYEKQEESLKWTFNDFIWTKRLSVILIFPFHSFPNECEVHLWFRILKLPVVKYLRSSPKCSEEKDSVTVLFYLCMYSLTCSANMEQIH